MTGTGPSFEDALALHDLGLAPVPAPAADGKPVEGAVAGFSKWRWRPFRSAAEDPFRWHPRADVGILPHLCRPPLVVVDRDDATAATVAEHHPGARPRMGGGKPCRARP